MKSLSPIVPLLLVAGMAFILGSAFEVNFRVNRKPWLNRLFSLVKPTPPPTPAVDDSQLASQVLPAAGITLPVKWSDLGIQLVKTGVIDEQKFTDIYAQRGGLSDAEKELLTGTDNGNIFINQANSSVWLNLLWALGLGNKNPILDTGPMVDKQFGGAGNFASTGGWNLAKGDAMLHYSKHSFIRLTPGQQASVEEVSKGIFRPCCNNATYFPDCNHGMAMLALLELMAAAGVSREDMYKYALAVNSYWFPDTYVTIAKYKQSQGVSWDKVDPKEVLGESYSSASGYRRILSLVEPAQLQGGGGCGV